MRPPFLWVHQVLKNIMIIYAADGSGKMQNINLI
jgi:hypothetical protein